jgi:hypothetical protein
MQKEKTMITTRSVVSVTPEQVSCELSGEVVVLSLKNGEYFGLNPVAASIWALIQTPRSVGEVRDALLEEFSGISAEECLEEVVTLLEELRSLELVNLV